MIAILPWFRKFGNGPVKNPFLLWGKKGFQIMNQYEFTIEPCHTGYMPLAMKQDPFGIYALFRTTQDTRNIVDRQYNRSSFGLGYDKTVARIRITFRKA
jgi:hypothetical protein